MSLTYIVKEQNWQKQLKELQDQIDNTTANQSGLKRQANNMARDLEKSKQEYAKLQELLDQERRDHRSIEGNLNASKRSTRDLQDNIDKVRSDLDSSIKERDSLLINQAKLMGEMRNQECVLKERDMTIAGLRKEIDNYFSDLGRLTKKLKEEENKSAQFVRDFDELKSLDLQRKTDDRKLINDNDSMNKDLVLKQRELME
jgi:uncharacterized protein (DUF3084 family)